MKIFVVGDVHFPFEDSAKLKVIVERIKEEQPTHVVQVGDISDQYSFSRYPRKAGYIAPEKEVKLFRKKAESFWKRVQQAAPNAKCFQLLGNHDIRTAKRFQEKLPELEFVGQDFLKGLFSFPGVTTMASDRDELRIGGILFIHGYLSKLGDHMKKNLENVVCGHSHRAGVVYEKIKNKIKWELNVGYVANDKALPLQYGQQKSKNWTKGYGIISRRSKDSPWVPVFVPLE